MEVTECKIGKVFNVKIANQTALAVTLLQQQLGTTT